MAAVLGSARRVEVKARAIALAREGMFAAQIGRLVGVNEKTVSVMLAEHFRETGERLAKDRGNAGWSTRPRRPYRPYSIEVRERAMAMLAAGRGVNATADELGIPRQTVTRWNIDAGYSGTAGRFARSERELAEEPRCGRCGLHLPRDPEDHVCVGIDPHARRYVEPNW